MITRRTFVTTASATMLARPFRGLAVASASLEPRPRTEEAEDLTQHVNPLFGTGGLGHCYPGASLPFGMVQLSPDTGTIGYNHCAGYRYEDTRIMGFSHTHLNGTGCGDLADALIMPGIGTPKLPVGSEKEPETSWQSLFLHSSEIAKPGYYAVTLEDSGIRAELTATERTGVHRYTFPATDASHFMLDLSHRIVSLHVFDRPIQHAQLTIVGGDTIVGSRRTDNWARGREVFFAMQFSRPFERVQIYDSNAPIEGTGYQVSSSPLRAILHFGGREYSDTILVKTSISAVNQEGALRNLQAEMPGWNFDETQRSANAAWQRELARVRIDGGTTKQRQIFYTGLYHTLLSPTLYDDVDGQYRGMDGEVHRVEHGQHNYSTFSLWDTYRAVHPLYTILQTERVPAMVNCLIRMSHESPHGVPIWPLHGKETFCMTGYHSSVVIAEALVKKLPGIDAKAAYGPLRKRAMEDDFEGLALYRRLGYIPCEREKESCSKTTDYAYNDWAVAHIARAAGALEDYKRLRERSNNYRNLFDQQVGFIRPRMEDRSWSTPFAPNEIGHSSKWRDYTESNSWQTTFAVPHDPKGLAQMLGGRAALLDKLDQLFTADSAQVANAPGSITGLVGQYAHGNEPSHHIVYLYAYAGAPYKTQRYVRQLMETMYNDHPVGMAGNEDCGQMSAWYVMSALGFYAVDPVSANYVFGTPLFDRAVIELPGKKSFVFEAKRKDVSDIYIQSVIWNGKPYSRSWFRHQDLMAGGNVVVYLGPQPNKSWGASEEDMPPSMTA